jgi:hypothetical protein
MKDDNPIDAAVLATMMQIWRDDANLRILILPRDAWTTLAVIQFATRNPQLGDEQRNAAVRVGRILQEALELRMPAAHPYLEDGWDAGKDVPR